VVRDALRKSKKVGLGQLALRGKEYLVSIKPCGKGLLMETLHYEDELRKSDSFFSEIPAKSADDELLEVATALIEKKTSEFDPKAFKDHYQAALRELIERKLKSKGSKVTDIEEPSRSGGRGNVVDLMSALKKSLEAGKGATAADRKAPARKPAAKSKPRATTRKKPAEMAAADEQLRDYRRKRDFKRTAEPSGDAASVASQQVASSCRSTTPPGCTTISASNSTVC
jgi:DNA end-binding protein Ku